MEEEVGDEEQEETYHLDSKTELGIEKVDNETLEETDNENKLRPRSPIRRNQERHEEKQRWSPGIIRSTRSTKGIRSPWFSINSYLLFIFTNPSARTGYDTRSIFKRSLTGLNSEFSFSLISCLTKTEEPSLP